MVSCLLSAALSSGCTGGSESSASQESPPPREAPQATRATQKVDAAKELESINSAIPIYTGAQFREDLTRRDETMIRSRYGRAAEVYTLASDDSFPQVYHYYMTYLAQFRAFPAPETYPPEGREWRTLEVKLNDAMQDPFIPGEALDRNGKQVTLQIAETEAEPRTVIRYIVTPGPAPTPAVAANLSAQPVAR
jgi:hypothetical protein